MTALETAAAMASVVQAFVSVGRAVRDVSQSRKKKKLVLAATTEVPSLGLLPPWRTDLLR
jgi:hypothetical protein